MALAQPSGPDRQPSPALSLSSNNPFRNRAASPAPYSPALPSPRITTNGPDRPVSRNPFLAHFETESHTPPFDPPANSAFWPANMASPQKTAFGSEVTELIKGLNVDDKPAGDSTFQAKPPHRADTLPTNGHRVARSDEEKRPMRGGSRGPPRPRGPPGPFDSPERRETARPRANSDTSDRRLHPDEERRRRERRLREREVRGKDGKPGSGRPSQRRKPGGLDLIDKLDVTGIYGPGLFHHDGPFDACNPHRNRKKDQRAPMQAFPAQSANMSMGGSGPLRSNIDLNQFHGRGAEGFTDYAATNAKAPVEVRPEAFNPIQRVEPVHGEETYGLGTSTFLEGAPASRTAIQRRESEQEAAQLQMQNGGLGRKKSLAQRFRGMSGPRRDYGPRVYSPEGRSYGDGPLSPESPGAPSKIPPMQVQSAGGMAKTNEPNPFFNEYEDAYEKKGASIKITEDTKNGRARAPSSPRLPLERRATADSAGEPANKESKLGGLMTRMRSIKGKRPGPRVPS